MNTDGDAALDKKEFANFFKTIATRKELENLMKKSSSNGAHMTAGDFHFFLVNEQGVSHKIVSWLIGSSSSSLSFSQ